MPAPDLTVLMTVYNGELYIRETMESVLCQTFSNFEFLIIDDGSTDRTKEIIFSFDDPRIIYVYQENAGTSAASNKGLSLAKGKYIARIDADDICMLNRFELQYNFLEKNPDHVLCASVAILMDKDGNEIFTMKAPADDAEIKQVLEHEDCIVHPSTFFKIDIARLVGGYYEPIKKHFEDYTFLYQLSRHGKVYIFQEPLVKYRLVPYSLSLRVRNAKYRSIALNIVKRGYAEKDELEFIFKIEAEYNLQKRDKLYNYYLLLAKLYRIEANSWKLSFVNLLLACKTKPFAAKYMILAIIQILMPRKLIKYIRSNFH
jgi:glycosyltransferase involved in cell wall biosynthesis